MSRPRHDDEPPVAPLRPVEFYVLLALARGDLHGYGIIQATERHTHGAVRLDPGTLYRAIRRLLEAQLLRESAVASTPDGSDTRRRTYTLTAAGRAAAAAEARRLARLVRTAAAAELLDDLEPVR